MMPLMEFWGVEVKPGQTLKCEPGDEKILHLSVAALDTKGSQNVTVYVTFDSKKLLIGTLSEEIPNISYDLFFEKEFELSHSSKNASVYFSGHKARFDEEDDDSDEDVFPFTQQVAPKPRESVKAVLNPAKETAKPSVEGEDSDDSDDLDEPFGVDESDDPDGDEDMADSSDDETLKPMGNDDDTENDDSDEEDEKTPSPKNKKNEAGKKRAADSASKTPVPEKKAKLVSPAGQKTGGDGKKHVATPHPAKHAAKTPANADQSKKKQQTPKSAGSVSCSSCSRTFNSEQALESHSKAKHGAGK